MTEAKIIVGDRITTRGELMISARRAQQDSQAWGSRRTSAWRCCSATTFHL
jgi:hypothetical protein